jgi:hypothetical protein
VFGAVGPLESQILEDSNATSYWITGSSSCIS